MNMTDKERVCSPARWLSVDGCFTRTNGSTGAGGVAKVSGSLLLASNNYQAWLRKPSREIKNDPGAFESSLLDTKNTLNLTVHGTGKI